MKAKIIQPTMCYEYGNNEKEFIYQGWMISSSPSTTPLEHPIYDVWLQDCLI